MPLFVVRMNFLISHQIVALSAAAAVHADGATDTVTKVHLKRVNLSASKKFLSTACLKKWIYIIGTFGVSCPRNHSEQGSINISPVTLYQKNWALHSGLPWWDIPWAPTPTWSWRSLFHLKPICFTKDSSKHKTLSLKASVCYKCWAWALSEYHFCWALTTKKLVQQGPILSFEISPTALLVLAKSAHLTGHLHVLTG